ncbi:NAD-dependent malic enzyme [Candidatus Woesearchaeota archaeon CG10_big_fil_rev_8_21_14_0_10_44_13]|nr:MAG: NAD-dependent malic enzyme [Candidatus Woesearchaeota archaeon CG10_big_fil_rev_8_21_14_0_10_44_13]
MKDINKKSLEMHKQRKGKISVVNKFCPLHSKEDLSLAYTPGVAEPCKEIAKDKSKVYDYTAKGNLVAVVTDGTAVLGLGDIGPEAAMPVMEGKAVLFKEFGDVDAFPICLATKDVDKIVETVKLISPGFGGINLEDISAPRCFEVEERLKAEIDIPVFHDDQHGTAIVVLAGMLNALKIVKKKIESIKIVFNGAGSAGIAVAKLLRDSGAKNITMCDTKGVIYKGRKEGMNKYKEEFVADTGARTLADAIKGADVFIGVSVAGAVTKDMVISMNKDAIIFAMANPVPEIMPNDAKAAGARIVATGRSDFPNQVNNVLAFPGVFRGALDARAKITEKMKLAAAHALAGMVKTPSEEKIIPSPFDKDVAKNVAEAVKKAAK